MGTNGNGKQVHLNINGKEVAAAPGETVWTAARKAGIEIPYLCASSQLKPYGSCRMCIVEVDGVKGFPASCTAPVRDGMKVCTSSEKINHHRKNLVELYLSEQPEGALEASGALVDLARSLGLTRVRYKGARRKFDVDASNPYFAFDANKCIACARCTRACDEIQGTFAISMSGRGFNSTVVAGADVPFIDSNCVSCGACVKECPTGALFEKVAAEHGEPDREVRTTCAYCGVGCNFNAQVKDNQVIRMMPVNEATPNQGHACVKGRFGWDYIYSKNRLRTPLMKKDGKFVEITWDEAIKTIATRFKDIIARCGKEAIGGISSARGTNEENYLIQKFMRCAIGTNNIDNCARVCHSATVAGMMETFGSWAATNGLPDVDQAKLLMIIGANPTEGHPVTGARIKRAVRNGAKLIVVDPRTIELCQYADVHLQLKPGTNVAVMNGLANVIIEEGLADQKFMATRTENFEAYCKVIEKYTPEFVEAISGVPADQLRKAARLYATSGASMCCHGLGMSEHLYGSYGVMSMCNLALLTGNIGRPGTGINPLRGQNNVQGSCDVGSMPVYFAAYQKIQDEQVQLNFHRVTGAPMPTKLGKKIPEMYDAMLEGSMKGLYVVGYDMAQTDPNQKKVIEALSKLDFLVVQDLFLNETAKMAHIVLPGASFLEKDGTFTNGERRIQRVRKVIDPVGQSRPDWQIMCDISTAMGFPMKYNHPSEIMDEIARLVPIMAGVTYDKLEADGLQWPVTSANHPGTPVMHIDKFPRGLGKFAPVEYLPPGEEPSEDYPFTMVTGRILQHYNCGVQTRNSHLVDFVKRDVLDVHQSDADRLGLSDGESVRMISRRGEIEMPIQISERVTPGIVFATFHFPEQHLNELLSSSADVLTKCPEYKVSTIRLEKIPARKPPTAKQPAHQFIGASGQ